ncbi:unnamed protein product [Lathyrus sativus]|nr:unnamed protein product [Lathyrus sativus]
MNLVSYNIRGSGSRAKRREICKLLNSEKVDLCMIQETKQVEISGKFVHSIWGNREVNWSFKSAIGSAGEMLLCWNSQSLEVISSFREKVLLESK